MSYSRAVNVAKRTGAKRVKLHGFFPGAKVKRGKDWEWGNQDGKKKLFFYKDSI